MNSRLLIRYLLLVGMALPGCNWMDTNYRPFPSSGYRLYVSRGGDAPTFWFDVQPDKFRELGGARSPAMIKLMEGELGKESLCPRGYSIVQDGGGKGFYTIQGRCK